MKANLVVLGLAIVSGTVSAGAYARDAFVLPEVSSSKIERQQGTVPTCIGNAHTTSDENYENAYAWGNGGEAPPNYGAFAMAYQMSGTGVCGAIFDMTRAVPGSSLPMDVYIWNDEGGQPGNVLALTPNVNPGAIPVYPSFARVDVEVSQVVSDGTVWVGYWGNWPGQAPSYFVGADYNGPNQAMAMTNIAPGIGFPTGWQDCAVAFPPVHSLGIAVRTPNPLVSVDPVASAPTAPQLYIRESVLGAGMAAHMTLSLPSSGPVSLGVFDVSGREVATLLEGTFQAGERQVSWDPAQSDTPIGSGVYWARMSALGGPAVERLVVIR